MKIIIVCESISKKYSGGKAARYLSRILTENHHDVLHIVTSENDDSQDDFIKINNVIFLPTRKSLYHKIINLGLLKTKETIFFSELVNKFKPDIVHFASFDISKPARFILEAKNCGAKVILQPWTMDFFCAQRFGFLKNNQCKLCVKGNFSYSIYNRCSNIKESAYLIRRFYLKKMSLLADHILSSNSNLDEILLDYGVTRSKISRYPIQFDCDLYQSQKNTEEKHFVYYGQPTDHKGFNLLLKMIHRINTFAKKQNISFKLYPMKNVNLQIENTTIHNDISWNNGLKEAIISSRAVLVPTLWNTSTEYSLYEAMIFKKPVIAFNVGAHKNILENGYNALVVDEGDIDSYLNAIYLVNDDFELRKHLGNNAFDSVRKINDKESLYRKIFTIYTK